MIPLYYRGEKLLTKKAVMQRLRIGELKLEKFLEELEFGAYISIHGHRLFMDEEGVVAKKNRTWLMLLKKMTKVDRNRPERLRTSLLAPGYCVHRLGVWHG